MHQYSRAGCTRGNAGQKLALSAPHFFDFREMQMVTNLRLLIGRALLWFIAPAYRESDGYKATMKAFEEGNRLLNRFSKPAKSEQ
jgi:hypothetical protein